MPINQLQYCLALYYAPSLGPARLQQLLQLFPDLCELFTMPKNKLATLNFPTPLIKYLQNPNWQSVEADLKWAVQPHHHILTLQDSTYPHLLKEIYDPPWLLFVKGSVESLASPQLAMVGSRNASKIGLEIAYEFASKLAHNGLTITSGLALGIDQASHQGVLAANGCTIAVLGTGLKHIYPAKHIKLADNIVEHGALVSEFPLDTKPLPAYFPQRNRIISGLSLGTLVVEASLRSGSLITARFANEQNRDVFAIPGSIHNPLARGCHSLLKQGAKLVEEVEDILAEIHLRRPPPTTQNKSTRAQDIRLAEPYLKLLECIGYEPTPTDSIIQRSGLTAAEATSALLLLELQDCISSCSGGYLRVKY